MPKPRFKAVVLCLFLGVGGAHAQPEVNSPSRSLQLECAELTKFPPDISALADTFVGNSTHAALWQAGERLPTLLRELESLVDDGLDPEDYAHTALMQATTALESPRNLSECWGRLASLAYLQALSDLAGGRLNPIAIGHVWYPPGSRSSVIEDILPLAREYLEQLPHAFALARPALPEYRNLRRAYIKARHMPTPPWPTVPSGGLLRQGDSGARVGALRQRLVAEGLLDAPVAEVEGDHPVFGIELRRAVEAFQLKYRLRIDGIVGPQTLAELNISPRQRRDQLRVNLERWRWLARDMEAELVLVDIAGAEVSLVKDTVEVWRSRSQVGLPHRPTPALKSKITYVTINPSWTVPPTIFRRDKLPEIRKNLNYLAKHHLRVLDSATGRELDPANVDWHRPRGIILRQDPGPGGALGLVALRFANPFSVYLHDTPNQHLFETSSRFYSSGCVRVEGAMSLVRLLFAAASEEKMEAFEKSLQSPTTRNISLPRPVALLMAYWTAEADSSGEVYYRPDIYHLDDQVLSALRGGN